MALKVQLDFREVRAFEGDRRKGFEELICQIARRRPPTDPVEFRRVDGAGGDGGVEAYWRDAAGSEHGFQAKYFLATKDIDWAQVDESVKTALSQHPQLKSYVVAFACDLTDRSGAQSRGKTGWQHWDTHKEKWQQWAKISGMTVDFHPWTRSDVVDFLTSNPDHRGLVLFWFEKDLLGPDRLRELFERARADLGERFHPEDNVRVHLIEAFEGLRRSRKYKKSLASWYENFPSTTDFLISVEYLENEPDVSQLATFDRVCKDIRAIASEIRSAEFEPLPLERWGAKLDEFWECNRQIGEFFHDHPDRSSDSKAAQALRHAQTDFHKFGGYADSAVPIHRHAENQHPNVAADQKRLIVVVGEPGSGKSHLFADAVSSALHETAPAVLLLGQNFHGSDIRNAFLHNIGLQDRDIDSALQALDAAGELCGQRTLILIDALNEAGDLRIWPTELAGFANDILKYPHLSLGFSLRPEYFDILLPDYVKKNGEKLEHRGVVGAEEQELAAIQYFEKRGIARPTVPWLAPEFSNFLFLRTVCNALAISGATEFPRGLRGSLDVLRFYLDSIDAKIRSEYPDAPIATDAVARAAQTIATWMADRRRDSIDLASATELCRDAFSSFGPTAQKSWLAVLVPAFHEA